MPLIENTDELEYIQCVKIKDLPLDTLLLTREGKLLISLVSAIENAKINSGLLAVYREGKSMQLSDSAYQLSSYEIEAFQFLNPELWEVYNVFESNRLSVEQKRIEGLRLTKSMIYALILAVEGGSFERGAGSSYNAKELESAAACYEEFFKYSHMISETERTNLMAQVIIGGGYKANFGLYWKALLEDACIAVLANNYCRLILQYEPSHQFNSAYLSKLVDKNNMRKESIKKEYDQRNPFKNYSSSEEYYHYLLIQLLNEFLVNPAHKGREKINFYGETASVSPHIKKCLTVLLRD